MTQSVTIGNTFFAQGGQGSFFAVEESSGTDFGQGGFFDSGSSGVASVDVTMCESTNQQLVMSTAIVDGVALVLFFLLYVLLLKRLWMSKWPAMARFFILLFPFAAGAGGVMSQVRWRSETYQRCLASPDFQSVLLLPGIEPWVQGVVLGFGLTAIAAFVVQLFIGFISSRR